MCANLENLELTPSQLELVRAVVQRQAYFKWLDAGCPQGREFDFWREAEREWIEHSYVPQRYLLEIDEYAISSEDTSPDGSMAMT